MKGLSERTIRRHWTKARAYLHAHYWRRRSPA